nr:hypothetical protein [uncultured Acidovorax sp.]
MDWLNGLSSVFSGLGAPLIAAAAALIGVLVGEKRARLLESRKRTDDLNHLAAEVLSALHPFAAQCAAVAWDSGEPQEPNGDYQPQAKNPEFDKSSLKVEWKVLPYTLQRSIGTLSLRQSQLDRDIGEAAENDWDPPEHPTYFRARREGYAKLGLSVLEVMRSLEKLVNKEGGDDLLEDLADRLRAASEQLDRERKEIEARKALHAARKANNVLLAQKVAVELGSPSAKS